MANQLFNMLGNQLPMMNGGLGNMASLITQFNQFRNNFQGDPKAQVQEMLNSGKITQEQFNQVAQLATQFQKMIGK